MLSLDILSWSLSIYWYIHFTVECVEWKTKSIFYLLSLSFFTFPQKKQEDDLTNEI